jgi:DNA invertase Pin-like site-specific DNA recombinase
MHRVVIYARCSGLDQETQNQIDQLKQYAASQQWEVVQVLTDNVSGGKGISERKGLEQVFAMAHRRKVDIVLFWALDRLSREGSRKTIEYLTRLESMGVDWHSYSEPYLSSLGLFKDAIIAILSALAKQEKVRIGERTRAGMERWRKQNPGKAFGRPRTTIETIAEVRELKESGMSLTDIGKRMGVSAGRACQIAKLGNKPEGVEDGA